MTKDYAHIKNCLHAKSSTNGEPGSLTNGLPTKCIERKCSGKFAFKGGKSISGKPCNEFLDCALLDRLDEIKGLGEIK